MTARKHAAGPLVEHDDAPEDVAAEMKTILRNVTKKFVEQFPLAKLVEFPGNPKDHDVGAISESMQANGIVDPLIVQDWPKTPKYILSGHGRKKTLLAHGVTHVDVIFVKMNPRDAKRYVLAANRAQERGGWIPEALLSFTTSMLDDLQGTGFDRDDVDDLHTRIHGTGSDNNSSLTQGAVRYQIVISCNDEAHQRELVEKFESEGLSCRLLTL